MDYIMHPYNPALITAIIIFSSSVYILFNIYSMVDRQLSIVSPSSLHFSTLFDCVCMPNIDNRVISYCVIQHTLNHRFCEKQIII